MDNSITVFLIISGILINSFIHCEMCYIRTFQKRNKKLIPIYNYKIQLLGTTMWFLYSLTSWIGVGISLIYPLIKDLKKKWK